MAGPLIAALIKAKVGKKLLDKKKKFAERKEMFSSPEAFAKGLGGRDPLITGTGPNFGGKKGLDVASQLGGSSTLGGSVTSTIRRKRR